MRPPSTTTTTSVPLIKPMVYVSNTADGLTVTSFQYGSTVYIRATNITYGKRPQGCILNGTGTNLPDCAPNTVLDSNWKCVEFDCYYSYSTSLYPPGSYKGCLKNMDNGLIACSPTWVVAPPPTTTTTSTTTTTTMRPIAPTVHVSNEPNATTNVYYYSTNTTIYITARNITNGTRPLGCMSIGINAPVPTCEPDTVLDKNWQCSGSTCTYSYHSSMHQPGAFRGCLKNRDTGLVACTPTWSVLTNYEEP